MDRVRASPRVTSSTSRAGGIRSTASPATPRRPPAAGGHLVALVGADDSPHTSRGMDPRAVAGYIPISAVWDVAAMEGELGPAQNEKVTYAVFGRDRERWAARSPLSKLHSGMQPF